MGDQLFDAAGDGGVVDAVALVHQPEWMYNFSVDTAHTYFVGDGQWLVHNQVIWFKRDHLNITQIPSLELVMHQQTAKAR